MGLSEHDGAEEESSLRGLRLSRARAGREDCQECMTAPELTLVGQTLDLSTGNEQPTRPALEKAESSLAVTPYTWPVTMSHIWYKHMHALHRHARDLLRPPGSQKGDRGRQHGGQRGIALLSTPERHAQIAQPCSPATFWPTLLHLSAGSSTPAQPGGGKANPQLYQVSNQRASRSRSR